MIISDDRNFIFVHVEKTAGSSIGRTLAAHAIERPTSRWYGWLGGRDYHRVRFGTHAPLRDAQRHMPTPVFEGFFKFAFVRNPWDRLVSEYNAAMVKGRSARHRRIRAMGSFDAFVRYEIRRRKFFQYPRICDALGQPALDFVGRFETLASDFASVCRVLGIAATLPRLNAYAHAGYREYYDDELRELVGLHWRRDIEYFDYAF